MSEGPAPAAANLPALNIIGAGRLGRMLGILFTRHALFALQDVATTSSVTAAAAIETIGAGRACAHIADMRPAAVWLVAVPDARIASCSAELAATGRVRAGDIVFHGSGALASGELAATAAQGAACASIHPIKTIPDAVSAAATFAGTWCGVEGDDAALAALVPAVERIGGHAIRIRSEGKAHYHAAGVFASNYVTALAELALRCFDAAGVDRADALLAMSPLMKEAVENVLSAGPRQALTGPVSRGDYATVARELAALASSDVATAEAYRALGQVALQIACTRNAPVIDAAAMSNALAGKDG